jgi:hypothetical protein
MCANARMFSICFIISSISVLLILNTISFGAQTPEQLEEENIKLKKELQQKTTLIVELREQINKKDNEIETLKRKYLIKDTASVDFNENDNLVIRKPFVGIYLGETIDSLKKRFDVNGLNADTYKVKGSDSELSDFTVHTYEGRIYSFECKMKGDVDSVRNSLIHKYGKPETKEVGTAYITYSTSEVFKVRSGRDIATITLVESMGKEIVPKTLIPGVGTNYEIETSLIFTHDRLKKIMEEHKSHNKETRRKVLQKQF